MSLGLDQGQGCASMGHKELPQGQATSGCPICSSPGSSSASSTWPSESLVSSIDSRRYGLPICFHDA